jgi:ribosomal protection tetracycline resistance protein
LRTLNLGILAHVDAGKTTLTERLLYAAGVIDEIGSVDAGTTQTDSLELERRRGITIKAAVVSFAVGDITVNLIDTPGHPDFIAEVERTLDVLDGAVLVLSAVEGVQSQTRVLMRTLRRLHIPTLIFVNKVDRAGADGDRVLRAIADTLTPAVISMGVVRDAGHRHARFARHEPADPAFHGALAAVLGSHNDAVVAAFIDDDPALTPHALREELGAQTRGALVHPTFFGSAVTGAGVDVLTEAIAELLPAGAGDADGPVAATVFKVDRGPAGEKVAYVRMRSGTLRTRDRVRRLDGREQTVTAIRAFEHGRDVPRASVSAGRIAKVWGLADARIGDAIGDGSSTASGRHFGPPSLETAVVPRRPSDKGALRAALDQLAEQDPLINVRQDDVRQEIYVSLYGEVQKEVIEATFAGDFGIEVAFRETTPICIERPVGTGAALEILGKRGNPFLATLGFRVAPAPIGSGLAFALDVDVGSVPMFVYKTVDDFRDTIRDIVADTLQQGLHGWQVTDCAVTITETGYVSPGSTAADFRKLTPLVLMSALARARTVVCEPIHHFSIDGPEDALGPTLAVLAQLRAVPQTPAIANSCFALEGAIPAENTHRLQRQVAGLTHGEGVFEHAFDCYEPVTGHVPVRGRTDHNPLNRKEYLLHVLRRV